MTPERQEEVYSGDVDYREGRGWVDPDGTGKSMGDVAILVRDRKRQHEDI